jgi:V8-like Glu-specific endopeptidase
VGQCHRDLARSAVIHGVNGEFGCGCSSCTDRRAMVAAEYDSLWRLHGVVEEEDSAIIGPVDNRVQEVDTQRFPWNTICHLCRVFPGNPCAGCSGTLIAPDIVLTAGHCLWSQRFSGPPRAIHVAPGRIDRDTPPYGTIKAAHYWVPRGFIDGPDRAIWDFGVIHLVRPFRQIKRFMPMVALDDPGLHHVAAHRRLSVAGYPSDRPIGTMWRHSERLKRVTVRRLFYSVSTCPGHSGSSVTIDRGRGPEIIAVHTTGVLDTEGRSYGCARGSVLAPASLMNSGVRLTPAIIDAILRPGSARHDAAAMVRLK